MSHMESPVLISEYLRKIHGILVNWSISENLSSLTLENASADDIYISLLKTSSMKTLPLNGDLFYVCYCVHILNLIVQEESKDIDLVLDVAINGTM